MDSTITIRTETYRHLCQGCDALAELMTAIDEDPLAARRLDGTDAMKQAAVWTDAEAEMAEVV